MALCSLATEEIAMLLSVTLAMLLFVVHPYISVPDFLNAVVFLLLINCIFASE